MTRYVLGFLFNKKETDVLLIQKRKPVWQAGKFNGLGGKIEAGETPDEAIRREVKEESGIDFDQWKYIISMGGNDWEVLVFTGKTDDVFDYETLEAESVNLIPLDELDKYALISNLYWLIPMCLDKNDDHKSGINYSVTNHLEEIPTPSITEPKTEQIPNTSTVSEREIEEMAKTEYGTGSDENNVEVAMYLTGYKDGFKAHQQLTTFPHGVKAEDLLEKYYGKSGKHIYSRDGYDTVQYVHYSDAIAAISEALKLPIQGYSEEVVLGFANWIGLESYQYYGEYGWKRPLKIEDCKQTKELFTLYLQTIK